MEAGHKRLQASPLPLALTDVQHPAMPFLGHKLLQLQKSAGRPSASVSAKEVTHVASTCPTDIYTVFLSGFSCASLIDV